MFWEKKQKITPDHWIIQNHWTTSWTDLNCDWTASMTSIGSPPALCLSNADVQSRGRISLGLQCVDGYFKYIKTTQSYLIYSTHRCTHTHNLIYKKGEFEMSWKVGYVHPWALDILKEKQLGQPLKQSSDWPMASSAWHSMVMFVDRQWMATFSATPLWSESISAELNVP